LHRRGQSGSTQLCALFDLASGTLLTTRFWARPAHVVLFRAIRAGEHGRHRVPQHSQRTCEGVETASCREPRPRECRHPHAHTRPPPGTFTICILRPRALDETALVRGCSGDTPRLWPHLELRLGRCIHDCHCT
jgi:hypothetical protein